MLYFAVGAPRGLPTVSLMAQAVADSSKRTWLKAAEVCDRAQVQAYVLRTWEIEFADLGVVKNPGGPRMYRPADLERVLRIKQLVFVEGLTLAGARRKLEEERQASDELPFEDEPAAPAKAAPMGADARKRLTAVRNGLRALLTMLSQPLGGRGMTPVTSPTPAAAAGDESATAAASRKTTAKRRKAAS
jgi:DNA-binding transcriptional MerR regulator